MMFIENNNMKVSIMQPYFIPYLGYFQMISSVDKFIFYDDVNYIKNGWINKNYIKNGDSKLPLTIPIKSQSSFKKINETNIDWENKSIPKLIKTLHQKYSKKNSALLSEVLSILENKIPTISELNICLIQKISDYLEIETQFIRSSDIDYKRDLGRTEKIIDICFRENANIYINPIGGTSLYNKQDFINEGIMLYFINGSSSLSILDLCMTEEKKTIIKKLNNYTLL